MDVIKSGRYTDIFYAKSCATTHMTKVEGSSACTAFISYRRLIQIICIGESHSLMPVRYYEYFSHLIKYEREKYFVFTVIYRF